MQFLSILLNAYASLSSSYEFCTLLNRSSSHRETSSVFLLGFFSKKFLHTRLISSLIFCLRWSNTPRSTSTSSPFPVSGVWHPAHPYQLSVLHNHWVNNLPAENTPPPKVFMRALKFIVGRDAVAAMTFHKNASVYTIY